VALALDEPTIKKLPEGSAHAVGARGLLVDQIPEGLIGRLGTTIDGL
jgi:hypothetical protein